MPAASVDIARPVISPDDAQRMVKDLRELIAKILVPNQHYQKIRGKDVLLKAGAEELGKFFGLSSGYSDLETHSADGEFFASVKCSVTNSHGRVLAESYGFYGSDEHKGKAPANTVVKMAQKRAYVGAILTATGTSELFTQDVEDVPAQEPQVVGDRLASDDEKRCLVGLFAQKGGGDVTAAAAWLNSQPQPKRDSRNWVAIQVLGLAQKPDPTSSVDGPRPGDVIKTEPEIPAEPGVLEGEITEVVEVPWEDA
jgi:hypothetical protein